ncbi:hypothetical protein SCARD494_13329 [Seiridium cardinale]
MEATFAGSHTDANPEISRGQLTIYLFISPPYRYRHEESIKTQLVSYPRRVSS